MPVITCLLAMCVENKVPFRSRRRQFDSIVRWGHACSLGRDDDQHCPWHIIVLCSNGLQCSHVLIHWQSDVGESGCTPADILHSPCVMCRHYTMLFLLRGGQSLVSGIMAQLSPT